MPCTNRIGGNKMKKYELTFNQYCEDWLNNSRYKESYLKNSMLWNNKREQLLKEWVKELENAAIENIIPSDVLMSYIRIFGENALFSTFRGVHLKGIQNFRIPKKVRD
jgi:hypothetical protein